MKNKKLIVLFACILLFSSVFIVILSSNLYPESLLAFLHSSSLGGFRLLSVTSVCVDNLPQVSATWIKSKNAKSYVLERRYPWPSNWEITGETSNLSFTDATWEPGYSFGAYTYRVRALNGRGSTPSISKQIRIESCNATSLAPALTSKPIPTPAPTSTPASISSTKNIIGNPSLIQTPTSTPILTPANIHIQWGAYAGNALSDAANFESLAGRAMNMQAIFIGWGTNNGSFPSSYKSSVGDKGKTLVIFWEQYGITLDQINSGQSDAYIIQFAEAAKTYERPIILTPLHEMNGNWDPWGGTVGNNTPAKVISAWKRIHNFFNNAPNVKFAWDVNSNSVPDIAANAIASYYPGDAYVDYVAVNGFNFGNPWQSFSSIFDAALAQLKTYRKPIYILSMASAPGAQKAAWITDALTIQIPKHPEIVGWLWFNQNKEQNWLVNSDANSLASFKAAIPQ